MKLSCCFLCLVFWGTPGFAQVAQAGQARTLALVPDPTCRSNRLILPAEEGLAALSGDDIEVSRQDPKTTALALQYILLVREEKSQVIVQMTGRVFENASGKLLAEGTASSEPFGNDEPNRQQAARQAGQRLAEVLSAGLVASPQETGKGRRVMVQITLGEDLLPLRDPIERRLKAGLKGFSPSFRGGTERTLVMVIRCSESIKKLSQRIEKVLQEQDKLQATWMVQLDSMMMLHLSKAAGS
jgi:hypothetical protein